MQTATLPKTTKIDTSPALRTLAVIDLGNGLVKALLKAPGATKFTQVSFPSYVAEQSSQTATAYASTLLKASKHI